MEGGGIVLFASRNLQDGRTRADLTNSCGATNPLSEAGCWPLPKQLKVATNVAPLSLDPPIGWGGERVGT